MLTSDFSFLNLPGDSGSRVRELSAPLAAAGISILYQSSYLSDFIFVKDFRLEEVMKLLGAEGFTLYNTSPYDLPVSSPLPPGTPDYFNERVFPHLQDEIIGYGAGYPGSPGAMTPAILSRTRSPSSASLALSRPGTFEDLTASTLMMMHKSKLSSSPMSSSATSRASRTPKKSLSPTAAPVEVLGPDLACVGLNDSSADVWSVKILTLVGYPELIPTPSVESTSFYHYDERRDSLADSLYGSMPKVHTGTLCSPVTGPLSPSDVFSHELSDAEKELDDGVGDSEPHSSRGSSSPEDNLSSCSSSDVEDEYFSSSSPYKRRTGSGSTPSLVSGTTQSSARSLPERLVSIHKSERPRLSQLTTSQAENSRTPRSRTNSSSKPTSTAPLRVPFFSFTRTAEGSSLTTDLGVLSALFGLDERHMVICSGTLLDAGDEINARAAVEEQFGASARARRQVFDLDDDDIFEMEEEQEPAPGTMKCLQIDLQKFGLGTFLVYFTILSSGVFADSLSTDKHGLVNRFSRVLEEHGINHMYSSTYKTANLLVSYYTFSRI